MFRDDSTQTGLSLSQSTSSITVNVVPALTILWHPDPTRIGSLFSFSDSGKDEVVFLSRNNPVFNFYCDKASPLADAYLSRQPILELAVRGHNLVMTPTPGAAIALDGKPLGARATLSSADIARSPILTIGRRIALCLHFARQPALSCPPDLGLLGNSDAMATVRQSILAVAPLSIPVLIRGETGTGKELTAQAIVSNGPRASKPFVDVNIGALPENLAAAEIFGHERGAFTGAAQSRDGYFHEANGGTLFLDEIGLAGSDVQTALLRVLETGEVRRLGGTTSRSVDVRLIAATDSTTIDRAVEGEGFSQALFHRLSASSIHLPPLRQPARRPRRSLAPLPQRSSRSDRRRPKAGDAPRRQAPLAERRSYPRTGRRRLARQRPAARQLCDGDRHCQPRPSPGARSAKAP
jgi:two-component system nitrogen regulation response regulator GlnG